jgi:hypothetical protein
MNRTEYVRKWSWPNLSTRLPKYLPVGTKENNKEDRRPLCRDLNPGLPGYAEEMLTTRQRQPVFLPAVLYGNEKRSQQRIRVCEKKVLNAVCGPVISEAIAVYVTRMGDFHTTSQSEILEGKDDSEYLDVDTKIILKRVLKIQPDNADWIKLAHSVDEWR